MALNTEKLKQEAAQSQSKQDKTATGQGFQNDRVESPKGRQSESDQSIHSTYNQVGGAIVTRGEQRLNQFVQKVVESRITSVNKAADILEMADSGELDIQLLVGEMNRRRERRALKSAHVDYDFATQGFDVNGYGIDLDAAVTTVMLDSSLHSAKAIAGV